MCGNTPQYADLEKLYEKYKDKLVDRWLSGQQFWSSRNPVPMKR